MVFCRITIPFAALLAGWLWVSANAVAAPAPAVQQPAPSAERSEASAESERGTQSIEEALADANTPDQQNNRLSGVDQQIQAGELVDELG